MFSQFTLLDWAIVAFPLLFLLLGMSAGAINILLSGLMRLLVALMLAQLPVAWVQLNTGLPGWTSRTLGVDIGLARLIVGGVVFLMALVIIMKVLAWLRDALHGAFSSNSVGRFLNQILGIPAGLFVGALVSLIFIVLPAYVIKRTATGRPPEFIQRSVLQPRLEARIRTYVDTIQGARR